MVKFSVVVPVYNEEGNILPFYIEVTSVMKSLGSFELIFVNDGSRDKSLDEMKSIQDRRVKIIDLKKNYGQAVAMDAGFRAATGDFIVTLDADLQNDPSDIPKLFEKLEKEKLDVVAGWRFKRKDPLWMKIVTVSARFLRGFLARDQVHDSGCTLRVYRRWVIEDLELWGEMHRYIIAILGWKGAHVGEIKVNHRPRVTGVTKYNWRKSFKGLVDLVYIWFWKKFSGRPLHLFGITGLFVLGFGLVSSIWTIYLKVFNDVNLSDTVWFVMSGFLVLTGLLLFVFGIIFDLLIRIYFNTSKVEDRYSIRKVYVGGK